MKESNAPVHNGVYVSGFVVGSVVFDHGVGLENVGADLITPADFFDFTADSGKLLGVFFPV